MQGHDDCDADGGDALAGKIEDGGGHAVHLRVGLVPVDGVPESAGLFQAFLELGHVTDGIGRHGRQAVGFDEPVKLLLGQVGELAFAERRAVGGPRAADVLLDGDAGGYLLEVDDFKAAQGADAHGQLCGVVQGSGNAVARGGHARMQGLGPEADDLRAEHIFGMAVDGYVLMGDQTFQQTVNRCLGHAGKVDYLSQGQRFPAFADNIEYCKCFGEDLYVADLFIEHAEQTPGAVWVWCAPQRARFRGAARKGVFSRKRRRCPPRGGTFKKR